MNRYFKTLYSAISPFALYGPFILIMVLGACKTAKRNDDSNFFQNVGTKYNILFNGNQLVEEAQKKRWQAFRENYQSTVPVFIDPSAAQGEHVAYLMDSVIQKAYTIVNTKQQSRYIPQAYFMMARAQYEKANHYEASELFRYVSQVADQQDFELKEAAYGWQGRMLLLTGRHSQAAVAIDSAFQQAAHRGKLPKALTEAAKAQWLIKNHRAAEAIPCLQLAVKASKNQKEKLRWQYLLGQLLEEEQQYAEAHAIYTKVAKSNAAFELSFNAALRCEHIESLQDPDMENHVQRLKKLARNNKSKGFTDQIHYLIAQAYLKAGDQEKAMEHLQLSIKESVQNDYQKTGSYLGLADLYFDRGQHGLAKAYYDSTATLLNSSYPSYSLISEKIAHIDELIGHWNTIAREDTLRALANLLPEQREQAIDSILNSRIPEKTESAPSQNPTGFASPGNGEPILPNALSSNHFYFNNPTAISTGMSTFKRRWGNRPLEDNWRLSNKSNLAQTNARQKPEGTEATSLGTATAVNERDNLLTKADYLNSIPDNAEKIRQSDIRISHTFFQIGSLYRDVLKDDVHAIASYAQLLERYPQLAERDRAYYNLYRLYTDAGQEKEMELYKQKLIQEFPRSTYTRSLLDPDYRKTLSSEKAALDSLYTLAYEAYTEQDFKKVIDLADASLARQESEEKHSIFAQLAYLRALSIGRTAPMDEYEKELKSIASKYPQDPLVLPIIKQQLAFIANNRDSFENRTYAIAEINANRPRFENEPNMTKWPELVFHADGQNLIEEPRQQAAALPVPSSRNRQDTTDAIKPFNENIVVQKQRTRNLELLPDTGTYYFVVNVQHATANLSPSRYGIGQFNRSRAETKALRHQLMTVQKRLQLIYIGQFGTYDEVKTYADRIAPLIKDIMKIPSNIYKTFIITQNNLELLTDEQKINNYIDLYKSNP